MTTTEEIASARHWLGRFFDEERDPKLHPARLPYDEQRRTCLQGLTALEREPGKDARIAALEKRLRLARRAVGGVYEGQSVIDLANEVLDAIDGRNQ